MGSSRVKAAKRVRFDKLARFRYIVGTSDMEPEEIEAVWFSAADFIHIRERESKVLGRIASANQEHMKQEDYLNSYGLESISSRRQRRIRMNEGRSRVFLEQELQWEGLGAYDEEKVARSYRSVTKNAEVAARTRAKNMEQSLTQSPKESTGLRKWEKQQAQDQPCSYPTRRSQQEAAKIVDLESFPGSPLPAESPRIIGKSLNADIPCSYPTRRSLEDLDQFPQSPTALLSSRSPRKASTIARSTQDHPCSYPLRRSQEDAKSIDLELIPGPPKPIQPPRSPPRSSRILSKTYTLRNL